MNFNSRRKTDTLRHVPTIDILWGVVGILVPMLIGIGMSFVGMSPPAFRAASVCFIYCCVSFGRGWKLCGTYKLDIHFIGESASDV